MTKQEKEVLRDLQEIYRKGDRLIHRIFQKETESISKELEELQKAKQKLDKILANDVLLGGVLEKQHISKKENIEDVVTNYMQKLEVPHNKGYFYIKNAIILVIKDDSFSDWNNITKRLYPKLAEMHNTTIAGVDKAMRYAIQISFSKINIEIKKKIFGNCISPKKQRPTNSAYVNAVAKYIILNHKINL